ncbi:hypothetical protein [Longimicrobium terrae]|uniref:Uncharacterized protein n=1 Tax=Longimicrobium terrae TaxID=1639882 RepID=A0A841H8Q5_9BACT|nr:hypothetical protein [Longimicrobium terrae]MBB4639673.1 hypothetical protein [Longimicrobium terrae]MBB6074069.1 hypothetical protein [Longimicrobium terrae]NNC28707.1 hypothetical protein [Longimicrobium terrae]
MTAQPTRTPDPLRAPLVELRRGLMRLHKALIDSERAIYEQTAGPQSNVQLLQALMEDEFFAWLRPFSRLITEIDGALHEGDPLTLESARGYIAQAHELVSAPADGNGADGDAARYEQARQRDPGVLFAHTEMHRALAASSLALDVIG